MIRPGAATELGESASGAASLAERCNERELQHSLHNLNLAEAASAR
jgi:mevalonate pyrophosphate decarboxylase